jgi:cytochrome P450
MTFMDPPRHREYRRLVDDAFRPTALVGRQSLIKQLAREVIDRVIDKGRCEFVEDIAMRVPTRTVLGLLGVQEKDYAYIANVVNVLNLAADPDYAAGRQEEFSGKAISKGDKLVCLLASPSRNEEYFSRSGYL